jgi:soluble lytic murein transglycosylase-like protein
MYKLAWKLAALAALVAALAFLGGSTTNPSTQHRPTPGTPEIAAEYERMAATQDQLAATRWGIMPALASQVRQAAARHAIPYDLAYALVWVESRFDSTAVSYAGAIGLTQVMPRTGKLHCDLSPDQLYNTELNLDCGFSYLAMLHDMLNLWPSALAAYNAGPARFARAHRTGEYSGRSYARLVLTKR